MRGRVILITCALTLVAASALAVKPPMFMMQWGGYGTWPGKFNSPSSVDVDSDGNVYVADTHNNRVQKFDQNGKYIMAFPAPPKPVGGLKTPYGIAVDGLGNVFVSDTGHERIIKFTDAGAYVTHWGTPGSRPGQFSDPVGIATDSQGNVYVGDMTGYRVQKFDNSGAYILEWGARGSADGEFLSVCGVAVDAEGYVYVADPRMCRIQKFDSDGNFITKWGSYGYEDGQFGGGKFLGVTCDECGCIYVADDGNSRIQIFDGSGAFLTKWGKDGHGEGTFRHPADAAVAQGGFVYVADCGNHLIQKFGPVETPTPVGSDVVVHLVDPASGWMMATVTFANVVEAGVTSLAINTEKTEDPYDFYRDNGPHNFRIETTALYTGFVDVCIHYHPKWYKDDSTLKLFHREGQSWVEITTTLDTDAKIICGQSSSLDLFGVFIPKPPMGAIAGHVYADCPQPDTPVAGVTIDGYRTERPDMVGRGVTDENGHYFIELLPDSGYVPTIVTPLGYSADPDHYKVKVFSNRTTRVDFTLVCTPIDAAPRSQGFWKHQCSVALTGKGNAQVDETTLCSYLDLIQDHFNSNDLNPVVVYEPPSWGECTEKIELTNEILNVRGNVEMIFRARQHLMALLLNAAAGYIALTEVISADGATVSQAITYCDNVIDDPEGDHEPAKDIADMINNGQEVPEGWIPLSTIEIAYSRPAPVEILSMKPRLDQNYPNPFDPATTIRFALPQTEHVELRIYDIAGRLVRTLVDQAMPPGFCEVPWDGRDGSGRKAPSGVYFYQLKAGRFISHKKMLLVK